MSKIPELRDKVINSAKSKKLGEYIWKHGVGPQMGYSFSIIHATAYSIIGFQTAYIATKWNPIYWNTACLIINSGSLEEDSDSEYEYEIIEDDEVEIVKKKEKNTDYTKMAKALGDIISNNIKVSLIDINKSDYSFKPDVENNQILFGMKALSGINSSIIDTIITNRPYVNFKDFLNKCHLNKTAMISLIKSGAFDNLETEWATKLHVHPRILIMVYYLLLNCDAKKQLTLQNFNGLIQKNLTPESLNFEKNIFFINKYLRAEKKVKQYYILDDAYCEKFCLENFDINKINIINGISCILQKDWDKFYQNAMNIARDWLKEKQQKILTEYNDLLFLETWNKYASGNISAWEMESLCFYYNEHELAHINKIKYGIDNFFNLPEQPIVEYFFKRNGNNIPIYKTYKIVGTVIGKNDTRSTIDILTTEGVVTVKFTKEYFANFNRQISEKQEDGTKKIVEKGWFKRGTKVMCTGFRRDDIFIAKSYKHTPTHQLYQITKVDQDGQILLEHDRVGQGD